MILSDTEVVTRLSSPLNLINRLRSSKTTGMELFIPTHQVEPQLSDESIKSILESIKDTESNELDEILPDNVAKIKLGIVKTVALDVLHDSIVKLGANLDNVSKVEKLATIARDMKNIITDEDESSKRGNTNVVVYKPITNEITKYETVVVGE